LKRAALDYLAHVELKGRDGPSRSTCRSIYVLMARAEEPWLEGRYRRDYLD
jgi:hypothetical protein